MASLFSSGKKTLSLGCSIVFLIPFLAAGLGMAGYGCYLVYRGHAAQSWPIVEGVVTHSAAKTGSDSDGDATEETDIRYAYAWQGRKLEGTDIRMGGDVKVNGRTSGLAEDLAKYPVGQKVQVRVDPDHPEKAVLESGVAWVPVLFFILFGAVFGGVPGLIMCAGIRKARKAAAEPAADAAMGDAIAFDQEAQDDAPQALEWTPIKGPGGANFQTSRLKEQKDGSWKVVPTAGMWLFAGIFGVAGMGALAGGVALLAGVVGKDASIWPKLIPIAVGAVFVLAAGAMVRGMRRGVVFAPGDRMCRGVVEDPAKFRKAWSDLPFSQVVGVQIASQDHAGDSDSSPYTSYQLNLVLKDFTRRHVMAHGKKAAMERDAELLAGMLRVPLWKRA